jgi:hypothetical protein
VEATETPDATRARIIGTPPGPDPPAFVVVLFLAGVPTVRVLTVESVDPPEIFRVRAPPEPAEVGVSSDCAVRKVVSDMAEEREEFGRGVDEGIRRVDRPLV